MNGFHLRVASHLGTLGYLFPLLLSWAGFKTQTLGFYQFIKFVKLLFFSLLQPALQVRAMTSQEHKSLPMNLTILHLQCLQHQLQQGTPQTLA